MPPDQHHAVQYAPPTGAATLYGTRHPTDTTLHGTRCPTGTALRSMRLPRMGAAEKLITMLRWVRPGQIVIPKLLRESRNKKSARIAIFFAIADCLGGSKSRIEAQKCR